MKAVQTGQCGLCAHFGEEHPTIPQLARIRATQQAPEDLLDDCGHPQHAPLELKVTPLSGCAGFEPAEE